MKKALVLFLLMFSAGYLWAQPGPPPPDPGAPVPFGGLEYLVAAGAAVGVRAYFRKRKNNEC